MNKENFTLIMDSLNTRIKNCENAFGQVKTTEDLLKISLEDALKLCNFCKSEAADMTKIVMVDFYHIIGMGDLTPPQMMKFTFAMRNYLNYRSDIKNIVSNLNDMTKLPKLPTKSKFKLLALCDLTLTKNVRPDEEDEIEFEDLETVADYSKVSKESSEAETAKKSSGVEAVIDKGSGPITVFTLDGSTIAIKKDKLQLFFNLIAPTQAYFNIFRNKVLLGKRAFGISWIAPESTDDTYFGVASPSCRVNLIKKFNL